MNAAGRRRLTPPLAVLAVALGALYLVFLAGVGRGVHWAPPRPPVPLPPRQDAKLPTPVPLDHYAAVWQHPLFSPDRKAQAHAASSSQLGDMQLTGIILMPGLRMALLQGRDGKDVRVREGDKLPDGSTTLVELHERSAVFDGSDGRVELKLPAAAPITQTQPEGPAARGGEVPNELPDDDRGRKPLDPSVRPGGEGPSKDEGPGPGASRPTEQPDQTPAQRQANRLRLLKAAIQRRRAAEAAAAAKKGDR